LLNVLTVISNQCNFKHINQLISQSVNQEIVPRIDLYQEESYIPLR